MILLIFIVILLGITAWLFHKYKGTAYKDYYGTHSKNFIWILPACVCITLILALFIHTCVSFMAQVKAVENIRWSYAIEKQSNKRLDDLTDMISKNLIEKYPKIEQEIFGSMGLEKANKIMTYFVMYPQLKSSATITTAVEKIEGYYNHVFSMKSYRENMITEMRIRNRDISILYFLIPTFADELETMKITKKGER